MMSLAQPWALLALLALPIIIALYALRPRRRRVLQSTVSIWREALRERQHGLGLQRLLRDISLIVLLLMALLLALALSDLRFLTHSDERTDMVLVLDVSASMQTRSGGALAATRFDAAIQYAHEIVDQLSDSSRLLIMTSGARPLLRTGFETDRDLLRRELDHLQATDEAGRARRALELALSLQRNHDGGKVVFVTDAAFDDDLNTGSAEVEIHLVGAPARNVAITQFDVRTEIGDDHRHEVLVQLRNYTSEAVLVPLSVELEGQTLLNFTVVLGSGETKSMVHPLDGRLTGRMLARIDVSDDLAADNTAYVWLDAGEHLRVLLVSPGNFYLETALKAMSGVRTTMIEAFDATSVNRQMSRNDVVVFDRIAPPHLPPGRYLLIDTGAPALEVMTGPVMDVPILTGKGASPMVGALNINALRVDRARPLFIEHGDALVQPLLWSRDSVLALSMTRGDTRVVAVGFDLSASNFPLATSFPLFLRESLDWLGPSLGTERTTQTVAGEPLELEVPTEQAELVVRTPSGEDLIYPVEGSKLLFDATSQAGFYRYDSTTGVRQFAVNLGNPSESDLRPRARMPQSTSSPGEDGDTEVTLPVWPYLLAAALLLLLIEWGLWCWRPSRA